MNTDTSGTSRSDAIRVEAIAAADRSASEDWDRFVLASDDGTLCHLTAWRRVFHDVFGHETHYLRARDQQGGVRGVLPLVRQRSRLFGDYMVSVPVLNYGGPCAVDEWTELALIEAATKLAAQSGVAHLELRTTRQHGLNLPVRTDKVSMRLALPETAEALWSALAPKVRAQVRRPQKEGAQCVLGGAELLPDFYSVFARNMRDLGTPVYPRALFEQVYQRFPEQATVAVVRLAGVPVAAGFLLLHQEFMEIPWASSLRDYNQLSPNMLLYWSVLEHAIERGCRCFDFGRSSVDSGTYRFKRQWGARPHPLYWYYWMRQGNDLPGLTPNNPKYRLAIRAWQRLPLPVANWLGPKLIKGLP